MSVGGGNVYALAIMKANDVLQTKYVAGNIRDITLSSSSIGDLVHIVIKNVKTNMGTTYEDAKMGIDTTTITINNDSDSAPRGTWTSTIVPENVTVELNCEVVNNSDSIVTANCGPDQWPNSVFNRIPIWIPGGNAYFGYTSTTNKLLFSKDSFSFDGSLPGGWSQYNVDGSGPYLSISSRVVIKTLPESFVSHWVNIGAKAYMGGNGGVGYVMLVPPDA